MKARAARGTVMRAWLLASMLCVSSISVTAQAPVARLDGVAAVVGGFAGVGESDVILRSDVELRARIALSGRLGEQLPLGQLPFELLAATLREIIGEHLIAREARRVATATPSEREVSEERARLSREAGGPARLSRLLESMSAERAEIDRIARRRATVAAFLRANLEGATVVTEAEVERAYAAEVAEGRASSEGAERELALSQLRARLAREALDRTIARWVAVLEARTPVRVHAEYAD